MAASPSSSSDSSSRRRRRHRGRRDRDKESLKIRRRSAKSHSKRHRKHRYSSSSSSESYDSSSDSYSSSSSVSSDSEHEASNQSKRVRKNGRTKDKEKSRSRSHHHKRHKSNHKEKQPDEGSGGPVQLSKFLGRDKDDGVRRSAVSGKKILLKVDKSKEDKEAESKSVYVSSSKMSPTTLQRSCGLKRKRKKLLITKPKRDLSFAIQLIANFQNNTAKTAERIVQIRQRRPVIRNFLETILTGLRIRHSRRNPCVHIRVALRLQSLPRILKLFNRILEVVRAVVQVLMDGRVRWIRQVLDFFVNLIRMFCCQLESYLGKTIKVCIFALRNCRKFRHAEILV